MEVLEVSNTARRFISTGLADESHIKKDPLKATEQIQREFIEMIAPQLVPLVEVYYTGGDDGVCKFKASLSILKD